MAAVFLGYFWRDPDRPIPRTAGVLVSPADGHVMFLRRERATGRRPSRSEAESGQLEVDAITGDWYPDPLSDPSPSPLSNALSRCQRGRNTTRTSGVWPCSCPRLTCTSTGHPQPVLLNGLNIARERGYAVDRFVRLTPKKANTTSAFVRFTNSRTVIESKLVQISGALARTVLPYVFNGDAVRRGQRIGMIRLGSRVDLRVPAEAYTSSIITAEDAQEEHPKGMHVMAGSSVVFRSTLEENE